MLNQKIDFTDFPSLKIAIISDTHQYLDPQVAGDINNCDLAIHAGDIGNAAVLDSMTPKSGHVIAVSGNNDVPYLWDADEIGIVTSLPEQIELFFASGNIAIEHGHEHCRTKPSHSDMRLAHPNARLIIYGHTHISVIDNEGSGCDVINPGAAGLTRNKGGPSCIILTIDGENWHYEKIKYLE